MAQPVGLLNGISTGEEVEEGSIALEDGVGHG